MSSHRFYLKLFSLLCGGAIVLSLANTASAQTYVSVPNSPVNFQSNPVVNFASATPLVMLNLSRDTTLFSRAYNDYSALIPQDTTDIQTSYFDMVILRLFR